MLYNILLIVTDQERNWEWLPVAPEWWRRHLPHRQRLRARGLTFNHFFAHSAPCSPSRSTLYTGRHIDETHVFSNVNLPGQRSMSHHIPTVGDMLRLVGYERVAYKGKFHLVKDVVELPVENGQRSLVEYGFQDWGGTDYEGSESTEGEADLDIAREAAGWLSTHGRGPKPWFLAVNFVNPHDINDFPWEPPKPLPDYALALPANVIDDLKWKPPIQAWWHRCLYDPRNYIAPEDRHIWKRLLDAYLHCMVQVDAQLGRVLDALEASGQADRTIIVFTSDHGELGGAHMLKTKGPEVYWESRSVPLVIVHPAHTGVRDTITPCLGSMIDLVPTLLSFAGSDGAKFGLRGRDLTPALHATGDTTTLVRDSVLFTYRGLENSLCPETHRNLLGIYAVESDGAHKFARYYMPDQADGRLNRMELELYDYADYQNTGIPFETLNRAYDPRCEARVRRLNEKLDALYALEVGEPLPLDMPPRDAPDGAGLLPGLEQLLEGAVRTRREEDEAQA